MAWLDIDDYAVQRCSWKRLLSLLLLFMLLFQLQTCLSFSLLNCKAPSAAGEGRVGREGGGNPVVVDC